MIDFRYHLVSIVSIFLALAVGIVLGAGPLQQQLGQTLTNQVSQLRKDKADLRTQVDVLQRQQDASEEFATTVTPALVSSRLGGRSVVLVLLPGADATVTDQVSQVLKTAGATLNGRVKLNPSWADPDAGKVAFRDQLSASLGPSVGSSADPSAPVNERMGALLAKALVVPSVTQADQPTDASQQALSGLREAGLVSLDGDAPTPATLAVVISGPPLTKAAEDDRKAELATWTTTVAELDKGSNGTVTAGSLLSAEPIGVIGAIRGDGATSKIASTVDDAPQAMGRVAVVFALVEQLSGKAGHYGTGAKASAVLPPLPQDAS